MLSFHGDQKIKDALIIQLQAHEAADEIIKGKYWEDGKGCAVGCTVHSGRHADYEEKYGIPRIIARLEDGIFERLPNDISKKFPLLFAKAVPVGIDLSGVLPRYMTWLLADDEYGVIKFANEEEKVVINAAVALFHRQLSGEIIQYSEWKMVADDIYAYIAACVAYAAYTPYAACVAYPACVAYAEADSCASSAAAYAGDASRAAANVSPQSYRIVQADKLIALLKQSETNYL